MNHFCFMNTGDYTHDVNELYNHVSALRTHLRENPKDILTKRQSEQIANLLSKNKEQQPELGHYHYAKAMLQQVQQRHSDTSNQLQQAQNSQQDMTSLKGQLQDEYTAILSSSSPEKIEHVEQKIRDTVQQTEVLGMRITALNKIQAEANENSCVWQVVTNDIKRVLAWNKADQEKELFLQELETFKQSYLHIKAVSALDFSLYLTDWANGQIKEQFLENRQDIAELSSSIVEQFDIELTEQ